MATEGPFHSLLCTDWSVTRLSVKRNGNEKHKCWPREAADKGSADDKDSDGGEWGGKGGHGTGQSLGGVGCPCILSKLNYNLARQASVGAS